MNIKEAVAEIRRIRISRNITQTSFAKMAGMHQSVLASIENGYKYNLRVETLNRLANVLGYKVEIVFKDL